MGIMITNNTKVDGSPYRKQSVKLKAKKERYGKMKYPTT
jgi:hypothetical protein